MHLQRGLSTINTRKRKVKITKAKMAELEVRWREHNKRMKQTHMHHMRYDTLEEYIDYCYGRIKRPDPRDRSQFKPRKIETNWRAEQDKDHRKKYPSLMEQQMKDGTYKNSGDGMRKKESMKYTGDLIQGIATMHKSNAVPVMKGTDQAKDIARMRR
tara:strand:+ start:1811 stop:2281 length:471 start_codon:yes stop_codon:yes gene_type:complete